MKIITKALTLSLALSLIGATSLMGTKIAWGEKTERSGNPVLMIPLKGVSNKYIPVKQFVEEVVRQRIIEEEKIKQVKYMVTEQKMRHKVQNTKNALKLIQASRQNRANGHKDNYIRDEYDKACKEYQQNHTQYKTKLNAYNASLQSGYDPQSFSMQLIIKKLTSMGGELNTGYKNLIDLQQSLKTPLKFEDNEYDQLKAKLQNLTLEYENFTSTNVKRNDSLESLNKSYSLKSFKSGLESKTPSPRSNTVTPSPKSTLCDPKFRNLTMADIHNYSSGSLSSFSDSSSNYQSSNYESCDDESSGYESSSDSCYKQNFKQYVNKNSKKPVAITNDNAKPSTRMFSLNETDRNKRKKSARKKR
ncbi:hypothetical protein HOL34_01095 [bacterium]|jgi:hypothetical protein|nr:hypothetical protein [bacterium]MBT3903891.1 hypothetical protein [bacterium]MBT4577896.1 hypothetical protein [bacterium]MBT5346031.1 hypothetical protein [bacterium]MBT6131268.1 hypothetical protein [bacterium]